MQSVKTLKQGTLKALTALLFVTLSFFSLCLTSQDAQAEDGWNPEISPWTFEFGFGYIGEIVKDPGYAHISHFGGFDMNFAINRKFNDWVSLLAFEGEFRVIIQQCDCENDVPEALGGSIFIAPRFYMLSNEKLDLYGKLGAGLIFPTYRERNVDFGLRFGFGANFWINRVFGLGFVANYDLAVLGTDELVDEGDGGHVGYVDVLFQLAFRW